MTGQTDLEIRDNDVFTGREVKRMFAELVAGGGPEFVSTTTAAKLLGRSPEWWRRRARAIPGAFQEAGNGPWTLPLAACRAYIERRQQLAATRSREVKRGEAFGRGPWKGAARPSAA